MASRGARCDYALYVGASEDNHETIGQLAPHCAGLKMYLNHTFSDLLLTSTATWLKVFVVKNVDKCKLNIFNTHFKVILISEKNYDLCSI